MSKIVIADSSCLIALNKIGKLKILQSLFGNILIPQKVCYEVVILGKRRPGANELKNAKWIETRKVENELAVKAFRLNLGAGESEAIALAMEQNADFIILDDWKVRQTAIDLSLSVIGTVAVLAKAEEKGIINDLQKVIRDLKGAGFYYSL